MFTGLIQAVGRVVATREIPAGRRLEVELGLWSHRPAPGSSIAVEGVCLTVLADPAPRDGRVAFDAVPATLQRTTIGRLEPGDPVNLEHAARADTLLGGHMVQGHVDGMGTVLANGEGPDGWRLRLRVPAETGDAMIERGSVAIAGVSLTIAELRDDEIEIALIPTTLQDTTLARLRAGDPVNVEADCIAKVAAGVARKVLGAGAPTRG